MNIPPFVLADRGMLREMGSGFRDRSEHFELIDLWPWIVGFVALVGALVALQRWLTRNDAQTFYSSPRALMRSLCQTHGLSRADQRLLLLIARTRGIAAPACLFLDPAAFEVSDVGPIDLAHHAEAITALKARLFASDAITAPAEANDVAQGDGAPSGEECSVAPAPSAESPNEQAPGDGARHDSSRDPAESTARLSPADSATEEFGISRERPMPRPRRIGQRRRVCSSRRRPPPAPRRWPRPLRARADGGARTSLRATRRAAPRSKTAPRPSPSSKPSWRSKH